MNEKTTCDILIRNTSILDENWASNNFAMPGTVSSLSLIKRYTGLSLDILNSSLLSQKIVITHNLDFAYALKDFKVLFLQKGSLKFFGSHSEFFIQENLNRFYGENLKLLDSHLVLDL